MENAGRNVIVIMSDEHNPKVMGCAGHPVISTPHLDGLAARGTRFSSAYTTSHSQPANPIVSYLIIISLVAPAFFYFTVNLN